jgi:predicted transcriptional regulator
MVKVPTARDCMSPTCPVVHPDMEVMDAIDMLVNKRASGAPVVDKENRLVGILTEKDCLRVLSNSVYGQIEEGPVRDYMSPVNVTVSAGMDLFAVAQVFLGSNFASLPVLEEEKLIGRISRKDMLKGIQKLQSRILLERRREESELEVMQHPRTMAEIQHMVATQKKEQLAALFSRRFGG